jgi:anti-sigma28 factor (negative regulator of flagellin synthesis)
MKTKLITTILLCLLLISTASALPSEKELSSFLSDVKFSDLSEVYDTSVKENPSWPVDLWENKKGQAIAFYTESDSSRGYKSHYYNDKGEDVSKFGCSGGELVKSHKGDPAKVTENKKETTSKSWYSRTSDTKEETTKEESKEDSTGLELSYSAKEISKMSNDDKIEIVNKVIEILFAE